MPILRTWTGQGILHGPDRALPVNYVINEHMRNGVTNIRGQLVDVYPSLMAWLIALPAEGVALTMAGGERCEGFGLRSVDALSSTAPFHLNGFRPDP